MTKRYALILLVLSIFCGQAFASQPNENPCNAITLTSNISCTNTVGDLSAADDDWSQRAPCVSSGTLYTADVWYKFTAVSTNHSVNVNPYGSSRAIVTVYGSVNGNCSQLSGVPGCSTGVTDSTLIDMTGLTVGQVYYIRIYYGASVPSNGQFNICVTHPNIPLDPADLVVRNPVTGAASAAAGDQVSIQFETFNQGQTASSSLSEVGYFFSTDCVWDSNDVFLGYDNLFIINPQSAEADNAIVTIPGGYSGNNYILIYPDYNLQTSEGNEGNNVSCQLINITNPCLPSTPKPVLAGDTSLCQGESTVLNVSNVCMNCDYVWSGGQQTASIIVSSAGSYGVTVTDICGNTDSARIGVSVTAAPVANAGQDQTIFSGDTVTLTATGAGTYTWSTGATTATINEAPLVNTSYTVTVTNGAGCTDADTVTITVVNCSLNLSAISSQYTSASSNGSFSITASNGICPWSLAESCPWINITSSHSGTGNATVTFAIDTNTGAPRSCSIDIGNGSAYTIYQDSTQNTVVVVPVVAAFTADTTSGCGPLLVSFTDASTGNPNSWSWTFTGGQPSTSTVRNPSGILFENPGTYAVRLEAANSTSSDDTLVLAYIEVLPAAQCGVGIGELTTLAPVIYPNPNNGSFNIKTYENSVVKVTDVWGRNVWQTQAAVSTGEVTIDLGKAVAGVYFVIVESQNGKLIRKVVVQ
jgi:PKD repeat protein